MRSFISCTPTFLVPSSHFFYHPRISCTPRFFEIFNLFFFHFKYCVKLLNRLEIKANNVWKKIKRLKYSKIGVGTKNVRMVREMWEWYKNYFFSFPISHISRTFSTFLVLSSHSFYCAHISCTLKFFEIFNLFNYYFSFYWTIILCTRTK